MMTKLGKILNQNQGLVQQTPTRDTIIKGQLFNMLSYFGTRSAPLFLSRSFGTAAKIKDVFQMMQKLQQQLVKVVPEELQLKKSFEALKSKNWKINLTERAKGTVRLDKQVGGDLVSVYIKPTPFAESKKDGEEQKEMEEEQKFMMESVSYVLVLPHPKKQGCRIAIDQNYSNYQNSNTDWVISIGSFSDIDKHFASTSQLELPFLELIDTDGKIKEAVKLLNEELVCDVREEFLYLAKALQLEQFDNWANRFLNVDAASQVLKP